MSGDALLCGWRVRSAMELPELHPWEGDGRAPDVDIVIGSVAEPAAAPVFVLPHSRVWADGTFVLALDAVGRFKVEGGSRVRVEPAAGASESELRAFLLGSVLGVLCHQRGLLPMHAAAVRMDGRAVLIAGISGAGKSTLAAALGLRGHALVADDVSAIDVSGAAGAVVLPAFPRHKLAPDVLAALQLERGGVVPNRPGLPKFHVSAQEGFDPAPLRPAAVYVLGRAVPGQTSEFDCRAPAKAMAELDHFVYRRGVGTRIQTRQAMFRALATLSQAAPVHVLSLRWDAQLSELGELAARVEAHVRGLARQ